MTKDKVLKQRKKLLASLKRVAEEKNMSYLTLSKKTGINRNHISRALSGEHNLSIDGFISVANAVGMEVNTTNAS